MIKLKMSLSLTLQIWSVIVARDEFGRWMWGLWRNIERCNVLQVEFWAIYDCLQLVWKDKWVNVIIEIDCTLAIKVIHGDYKGHSNRDLILSIKNYIVMSGKYS